MDLTSDSGSINTDSVQSVAEPKKKRIKKFCSRWLREFRGWLTRDGNNDNTFFCSVCNKALKGGKSEIKRHAKTEKHRDLCNQLDFNNMETDDNSHALNVKKGELAIAAFISEHNIAISIVEHLSPVIKKVCPDSEIIKDIKLSRKKCTQLIKNVIAKEITETLINYLKTTPFSIFIDESTDVASNKFLCVMVKFVEPTSRKIITQLLALLQLDAKDCSAERIFEIFKDFFQQEQIPFTNIVAVACDNASVMLGKNESFAQKLKNENPDILMLNCICHSSALVANKACENLMKICDESIRGIIAYVNGSPKRAAKYKEFQCFFGIKENKLLKLARTRWLSLYFCIERILENWIPLQNFLLLEEVELKSQTAAKLREFLSDIKNKIYMYFLKYVLNFLNQFNALFQSDKVLIHELPSRSIKLLKTIANNFVKSELIEDILNLNVNDPKIIKEKIYMGPDCEILLNELPDDHIQEVRETCLTFYQTCVLEICNRFPIFDSFLKNLKFIQPTILLNDKARSEIIDLTNVSSKFPRLINNFALSAEWVALPFELTDIKINLQNATIEDLWKFIANIKDINDTIMFPELNKLLSIILCLPQSNAPAERTFSIVTDVMCPKRNKMSPYNLNALCIVRSYFQSRDMHCFDFEVNDRHLELFNSTMYD